MIFLLVFRILLGATESTVFPAGRNWLFVLLTRAFKVFCVSAKIMAAGASEVA